MMRTLGCMAVLLAVGVARSAPPATDAPPCLYDMDRIVQFLSLAEARAIALEWGKPLGPREGLDSRIAPPRTAPGSCPPPSSFFGRVLARSNPSGHGILLVAHPAKRAEFEREVNQVLLNVETAYWNLFGSYWQLHSREQALRYAYETWENVRDKHREGKASNTDVAQAQGQYDLFRSQRLQAVDMVLDNERQSRVIMGLQIEDGTHLVPSDQPTRTEMQPDWETGLRAALQRPEVRLARQDVKAGKERTTRQDQELKAERLAGLYYRRVYSAQAQIKAASAQREAFARQMQARSDAYRGGKEGGSLDLLLESQRFWADALATECQAIVTYNNAIAGWSYARGAILTHAHVEVAEEAPAGAALVRALERERERTRAQVRREPGVSAETPTAIPSAASLPALWKSFPPLRDAEAMSADSADAKGDVRLYEWTVSEMFAPGGKHGKREP